MPKRHTIRLRGPWKCRELARDALRADVTESREEVAGIAATTQVSPDWTEVLGAAFRGKVRLTRNFYKPTGLDSSSRVDLVIDSVDGLGTVTLNGEMLGEFVEPLILARFDITAHLRPRNELVIDVDRREIAVGHPDQDQQLPLQAKLTGGSVGEVRLEIR